MSESGERGRRGRRRSLGAVVHGDLPAPLVEELGDLVDGVVARRREPVVLRGARARTVVGGAAQCEAGGMGRGEGRAENDIGERSPARVDE